VLVLLPARLCEPRGFDAHRILRRMDWRLPEFRVAAARLRGGHIWSAPHCKEKVTGRHREYCFHISGLWL